MKKIFTLLLIGLILMQCKKKEDKEENPEPSYEFQDQNLQGKINGQDWAYVTGETHYQNFFDNSEYWFNIVDSVGSDTCEIRYYYNQRSKIIFSLDADSTTKVLESKVWEFGNFVNATLVFYDDEGVSNNMIALDGAVEILTFDTITNVVTGKLDARASSTNFVNGNFTLKICD